VQSQEYDDSKWRVVDLPHDWAVEGPFDSFGNPSSGYRPRGAAWYRRQFKLKPEDRGKHIEIQFEGISASVSEVYFNGAQVWTNQCGYTSFYCDVTDMCDFGDFVNTIAVRADASNIEGWWYEGAGIYRNVWLVKRSAQYLVTDGVSANPIRTKQGLWEIPFSAEIGSCAEEESSLLMTAALL